jgi:glycosyltransferase involved in cell wall biosynthesis
MMVGRMSYEELAVIVAAHEEADRIAATVAALKGAFPGAAIWVGDDASRDGTAERAMTAGAQVVRRGRSHGKGGNVTAACEAALSADPAPRLVLLCDGDLGESAARLAPLLDAVEAASASRAASPAGRSGDSAVLRRARRSPASARCAPRRSAPSCPSPAASAWRSG